LRWRWIPVRRTAAFAGMTMLRTIVFKIDYAGTLKYKFFENVKWQFNLPVIEGVQYATNTVEG
jgi:hypothetical protein